jgi:hypothetical protein
MKLLAVGTLLLATASATVCGVSGYDNSGHNATSLPAYKVDTKATTPQLCSTLCKSDKKCHSFAIGKATCYLYAASTDGNFSPDSKAVFVPTRSPYYFYDISCTIISSSPPLPHSNPVCNVQGYDRGNPAPGPYTSVADCAAGCKAQAGCAAYAAVDNFVTRRGTGCFYYTSLVDNFDANSIQDPAVGSSFYFTELSCPGV